MCTKVSSVSPSVNVRGVIADLTIYEGQEATVHTRLLQSTDPSGRSDQAALLCCECNITATNPPPSALQRPERSRSRECNRGRIYFAVNAFCRTASSSTPKNAKRVRASASSSIPNPGLSGGAMKPFSTFNGCRNSSARRGLYV